MRMFRSASTNVNFTPEAHHIHSAPPTLSPVGIFGAGLPGPAFNAQPVIIQLKESFQ